MGNNQTTSFNEGQKEDIFFIEGDPVAVAELLEHYFHDLGITTKDHVYIKKVGNHLQIGRLSYTCNE